jgi:hypothetical protein
MYRSHGHPKSSKFPCFLKNRITYSNTSPKFPENPILLRINNSMENRHTYFNNLPVDIVGLIFLYLPSNSRLNICCTCKSWNSYGRILFDPSERDNYPIRWASEKGKIDCVKFLLKDQVNF